MKRIAIISFGFIASCVLVFSCSQQEKATPEKEKSVMYEASELALLMRAMHEQSAQWKKALENEEISLQFPSGYHNLFTAEPTNPAEMDEKFYAFAKEFITETENFTNAPIHLQKEKFNLMIQSCITCHESYCRGPIQKISKLKIE
jgi:hypothetical protein